MFRALYEFKYASEETGAKRTTKTSEHMCLRWAALPSDCTHMPPVSCGAHDVRCAVLQFPAQSKPERGTVHAMAHILGKRSPSSVSPSAVSPSLRLLFLLRSIFGGLASPPPAPDGSKFTAALRRCRATAPKPRPGCAPSARSACDRAEASTGLMLEASRVCATLNHSTAVLEYSPPWLSIHCSASLFVLLVSCGRALWGL